MAKQFKKTILSVIIIIILAIAGYFLYNYMQKEDRIREVNEYKKGFYSGLLCQYNCPLTPQENKNKTQMLPELNCVKECSTSFKEKYANLSFKKEELEKDNLLKDIDAVVNKCKKVTINTTALTFNNTAYFNCAAKNIVELKINYSYLN